MCAHSRAVGMADPLILAGRGLHALESVGHLPEDTGVPSRCAFDLSGLRGVSCTEYDPT
jgi:hypothetical protein